MRKYFVSFVNYFGKFFVKFQKKIFLKFERLILGFKMLIGCLMKFRNNLDVFYSVKNRFKMKNKNLEKGSRTTGRSA